MLNLNLLIFCTTLVCSVLCQRDELTNLIKNRVGSSVLPDRVNDTTEVSIDFSLTNILDYDYNRQELELSAWLSLQWKDTRLQWNPEQFDGIKDIRINANSIVSPDFKLYNGKLEQDDDVLVVIHHQGSVLSMPPVIIKAFCPIKTQLSNTIICHLIIGSWTYNCQQLVLSDQSVDSKEFTPGWRWNLKSISGKKDIKQYSCCPDTFCSLNVTIEVEDKLRSVGNWSLYNIF